MTGPSLMGHDMDIDVAAIAGAYSHNLVRLAPRGMKCTWQIISDLMSMRKFSNYFHVILIKWDEAI